MLVILIIGTKKEYKWRLLFITISLENHELSNMKLRWGRGVGTMVS